jgi:hypothetical protein
MRRNALRILGRVLGVVFTLVLVGGAGYVVLRLVPHWLGQPDKAGDAAIERGRIRTAALVFLGGMVAAAGAVFAGLTFRLSRRGQGTDRFNKAIELMGQGDASVRLGGIHALAQVARDDPHRHHRAVVDVLLAYVRDHSPWPPPLADEQAATIGKVLLAYVRNHLPWAPPTAAQQAGPLVAEVPPAPADVKAAMAVLARRNTAHDPDHLFIDLSNVNLRGIEARGIHLRRALLDRTQLQEADLKEACLEGAALINANLDDAELDKAALDKETSFEKASLIGTSLRATKGVGKADFAGAVHDPVTTIWPNGTPPAGVITKP